MSNLYEQFQREFTGYDSVLDVGCSTFIDLIRFEPSPFNVLHGIDKEYRLGRFGNYQLGKRSVNQTADLAYFKKHYIATEACITTYDFGEDRHNFIICRNVLHFFNDTEKHKIIQRLHASLQPGGLMFLKLHHSENVSITGSPDAIPLQKNVYGNKKDPYQVFYLADYPHFTSDLSSGFAVLPNFITKDEKALTIVIKK